MNTFLLLFSKCDKVIIVFTKITFIINLSGVYLENNLVFQDNWEKKPISSGR